MTAITTNLTYTTTSAAVAAPIVRRRLTPQAGRALEKLGHAIEYLSAEFVNEAGGVTGHDDRLDAIELLMSLNRQVYLESPQVPSLRERCVALFRHTA